jgi:hypothetical protein
MKETKGIDLADVDVADAHMVSGGRFARHGTANLSAPR